MFNRALCTSRESPSMNPYVNCNDGFVSGSCMVSKTWTARLILLAAFGETASRVDWSWRASTAKISLSSAQVPEEPLWRFKYPIEHRVSLTTAPIQNPTEGSGAT